MKQSIVLGLFTLIAFQASADTVTLQSVTLGNEQTKQFQLRCDSTSAAIPFTLRHTGTLRGVRTYQTILGAEQESFRVTPSQTATYNICGTQFRISVAATGELNVTSGKAGVTLTDSSVPVPVHENNDAYEGTAPSGAAKQ